MEVGVFHEIIINAKPIHFITVYINTRDRKHLFSLCCIVKELAWRVTRPSIDLLSRGVGNHHTEGRVGSNYRHYFELGSLHTNFQKLDFDVLKKKNVLFMLVPQGFIIMYRTSWENYTKLKKGRSSITHEIIFKENFLRIDNWCRWYIWLVQYCV